MLTFLAFVFALAIFIALGCLIGSAIFSSKTKLKEGEIELKGDMKNYANLINSFLKDYPSRKVVSNSDKKVTVISKDDSDDVGRVFTFSATPKNKELDVHCKKYPGCNWQERPTEYKFHLTSKKWWHIFCDNYAKSEKKLTSQMKQKMKYNPSVSSYKPLEDF